MDARRCPATIEGIAILISALGLHARGAEAATPAHA